jgi:hypothetical protein
MADILIQGGDAEAAAKAMRDAVREIFEIDPIQSTVGRGVPGTRIVDAATVILAIPPGIFYANKLLEELHFSERWRRLTARAEKEAKATSAQLMIDVGDGKPIPFAEASPEIVLQALTALQEKPRST